MQMSSSNPALTAGGSPTGLDRRSWVSFVAVTLIGGGTWIVIRGQLGEVAPQWSVTYRFVLATAAMFAFAGWSGLPLRLPTGAWRIILPLGLLQFGVNFNAVYLAERHITSGLVATVFALLVVPNSLLGWAFLGQRPSNRFFLASLVAIVGIALLFLQEIRANPAESSAVVAGIGLTLLGIMGASSSNVLQAHDKALHIPMPVLLAWSMLAGTILDALWALAVAGAPTFEWSFNYVGGLLYLGLAASALAFSLYFPLIRTIGPARAAYSSAIIPIIAMLLSTVFEGYRWTPLAAAGGILAIGGMLWALSSRHAIVPSAPSD